MTTKTSEKIPGDQPEEGIDGFKSSVENATKTSTSSPRLVHDDGEELGVDGELHGKRN